MSRSVRTDFDKLRFHVGGHRGGKRALARQTAAQFAREQIMNGTDPKTLLSLATEGGVQTITYEEAAEWAPISDVLDQAVQRLAVAMEEAA